MFSELTVSSSLTAVLGGSGGAVVGTILLSSTLNVIVIIAVKLTLNLNVRLYVCPLLYILTMYVYMYIGHQSIIKHRVRFSEIKCESTN